MILLTGVTGTVGREVMKIVASKDIVVRALVRDKTNIEVVKNSGIEVIAGDLEKQESVEKALHGIERAFLLMANNEKQAVIEKQFIDLARKANVSHIVKMSANNAASDSSVILKRYHGEAEEYLEQSGITYTFIRPDFFMQNLLHVAGTILGEDKFYLPMGPGVTGMVDVRNIADVIVHTLVEDGHDGRTYQISGPEVLSFNDVARLFSEVLGREIAYIDIPAQDLETRLLAEGQNPWYVHAILELFGAVAQTRDIALTDTFKELTGKKPNSLQTFIKDHINLFNGN
ncbi:MAG: SDR family oxidoreductase [Gammaproteobacteria bacterium]